MPGNDPSRTGGNPFDGQAPTTCENAEFVFGNFRLSVDRKTLDRAGRRARWWSHRSVRVAAALLLMAGAIAAGLFLLLRHEQVPARVSMTRNAIIAFDDTGRQLWKHVFERNLSPPVPQGPLKLDET